MKYFSKIFKEYWYLFVIIVLLSAIPNMIFIFYIQVIVSKIYCSHNVAFSIIFSLAIRYFLGFIILNIVRWFIGVVLSSTFPHVCESIKMTEFNKVFNNDLGFFFKTKEQQVNNEINMFADNFIESIQLFVRQIVSPIIDIVLMMIIFLLISKIFSLLILCWILSFGILCYFFTKKQIELVKENIKIKQDQSNMIFEYHKNILTAKIYDFHHLEMQKYENNVKEETKINSRIFKLQWWQTITMNTCNILFFSIGTLLIYKLELSTYVRFLQMMTSLLWTFIFFLLPIVNMIQKIGYCLMAEELFDEHENIIRNNFDCPQNYIITFKNVSKTIGKDTFLKSVNMQIKTKDNILLVGKSGSGKTTLFLLLLGILEQSSGSIKVNNKKLLSINHQQWLKQFSYVPQQAILYNDTIRNNIVKGINDYKEEDFLKVCKDCLVDDFVSKLENGYDSQVGISGNNLSGGQRQRVVLARALMRDYNIINGVKLIEKKTLCLDEAWASLSREEALKIANNLVSDIGSRGFIVIDHTDVWKTVCKNKIDKIYLIENGIVKPQ